MSAPLSLERTVTTASPSRLTTGIKYFGVALLVIFFVFGGPIVGPVYLACSDRVGDYLFLHSCPANEMRIKAHADDFSQAYALNLDTGHTAVTFQPYWERPDWGLFWIRRVQGIFHTIFAIPAPDFTNVIYPPDNLGDIRAAFASLSDTPSRDDDTCEYDVYLSAWNDGHWRMYSFYHRRSKSLQHLLALLWQNRPPLPSK